MKKEMPPAKRSGNQRIENKKRGKKITNEYVILINAEKCYSHKCHELIGEIFFFSS